ncbi:hypothetical protein [Flavobacterium sp. CS20]|uniref:TreTu family toxin n=1 Tax=Flavobacterium sp. CS20 TaxID=2775246 RepID=UPI001B3A3585|nr:hypothetical protein [Flavobacterium sp. CS20]QTY27910.1 hypothetical protein IGB25_05235 [Flavobacterium sp. CS20]
MKKHYVAILFLFTFSLGFAQTEDSLSIKEQERREANIQAGNPFKRFGYKPKIHTLSKGKYLEFHDLDSIVKIGSFSYHVKRKVVTRFTEQKEVYSEATLRPEIISRWFSPDPLAEEFPDKSPYNFVNNNPIRYVDPDGRAPVDWIKNRYGDYLWDDNAVDQASTRQGWTYVGKELPQGTHSYDVLTEVDGSLYHKNTTNLFAKVGNLLGGDFVEHKPYDPVGENNLSEGINTGIAMVGGNYVMQGSKKVISGILGNVSTKSSMTTVGRWMSQAEYNAMRSTGTMVEGAGGQTFVSTGGPNAFTSAVKGSVYAEFEVATNSLLQGGKSNWFKALDPNSGQAMQSALNKQGGELLPQIKNLTEVLITK